MRNLVLLAVLLVSVPVAAQSRRVGPGVKPAAENPDPTSGRAVKELFDEANAYNKVKFAEFEQKKVPVSETLIRQTQRERKQLAAKYATAVSGRVDLDRDETYYLGMLHWIAENLDGSRESFDKYLALGSPPAEKAQNARAILAVVNARQKKFTEAEKAIGDYKKGSPVRLSQLGQMERELAAELAAANDLASAAAHAAASYFAYKQVSADPTSRDKVIDELIDSGLFAFKTYKKLDRRKEADDLLADIRKTATEIQVPNLWYYAVDWQITYQIETGRKPAALENYLTSLIQTGKLFTVKEVQAALHEKLKRREKHYKILGEPAPELVNIDRYFPGQRRSLADLRGKVVLIDFWATWCAPCLEAFPSILEWRQDFGPKGFEVLGLTRYYSMADGMPADNAAETDFLERFARSHGLTYDFLIAKEDDNHRIYGATAIPTAVLIDRKGIVRYIESGTGPNRLQELREMIEKLVTEKQ